MSKSIIIILTALIVFSLLSVSARLDLAKERDLYRHQLIAVCGVVNFAVDSGYKIRQISLYSETDLEKVLDIRMTTSKEKEFRFIVFPDGKINVHRPEGFEPRIMEGDWGDYPAFSKIGKK